MFAPVPGEYAASYAVGANYSGMWSAPAPTPRTIYIPGRTIVLVRNPNWDPATDPLRKAWVDRIQVTLDVSAPRSSRRSSGRRPTCRSTATCPRRSSPRSGPTRERSRRLSVSPTGCLLFLILGTHRRAGAIADVRVRQAVNYAVDKVAYRDAVAGQYTAAGELASTILAPGSLGYQPLRPVPDPGRPGRPRQGQGPARRGRLPQRADPGVRDLRQRQDRRPPPSRSRTSLAKAGIRPEGQALARGTSLYAESLRYQKRLEHQLGLTVWCPDYLGDNARQTIVTQYDGLPTPDGANFSEYHNPAVNGMIDRALAEPDQARRAALWAETDQRIMRDAPMVPLIWETYSFLWGSRSHGWVYDPWTASPTSPPHGWTPKLTERRRQQRRNPMQLGRLRAACLGVGLALLGRACAATEGDPGRDGARAGRLRVVSEASRCRARQRAAASEADPTRPPRALYGYDSRSDQMTTRSPTSPPVPHGSGRPAHLHLHPASRGPLRPAGQPRGHRPGLHHRHPAVLGQGHAVAGRAAIRQPHHRRGRVRVRGSGQDHGPGRPRRPHPADHPGPAGGRPPVDPHPAAAVPCAGRARGQLPGGGRLRRLRGRLRPLHPDHLCPQRDHRPGA